VSDQQQQHHDDTDQPPPAKDVLARVEKAVDLWRHGDPAALDMITAEEFMRWDRERRAAARREHAVAQRRAREQVDLGRGHQRIAAIVAAQRRRQDGDGA
jgi:hypothetical protein